MSRWSYNTATQLKCGCDNEEYDHVFNTQMRMCDDGINHTHNTNQSNSITIIKINK